MSNKYPGGIITSGANAGYSVAFDGSGDYLRVASNAAFDLSGDFTIECWVYTTNLSPGYNSNMISRWAAAGGTIYNIQIQNGGTFRFVSAANAYTGGSITVNTWTHVAVTRSGTSIRMFRDGVLQSTNTDSTNFSGSQVLSIGAEGDGASALPGYISNARIVKGTALYTAAFTPPTQLLNVTNTSLLTCNSPAIVDQSSNAFTITANGNAAVSTFTPFQGYVAYNPALGAATPGIWTVSDAIQAAQTRRWNMYDPYFNYTTLLLHGNGTNGAQNNTFLDSSSNNFTITRNGNTTQGTFSPFSQTGWSNYFNAAYLSAGTSSDFSFAGNFTIEMWYYSTITTDQSLILMGSSPYFAINVQAGTGYSIYLNNATASFSPNNIVPQANTWNHVALVRSGSTVTVYHNGTALSTTATNSSTLGYSGNAFNIGWSNANSYISNLRVVNGTAVYTSNFTPSTTPLTDVTNTKLLTCQSNRFVDTNTQVTAKTITVASGTPSVQAFSPFYPVVAYTPTNQGGSGYFDGTVDNLTYPAGTSQQFGTSAFTVECWVYFTADPHSGMFLIDARDASNTSNWCLYFGATNSITWLKPSGTSITNSTAYKQNTWYHVAYVRSGTTGTIYVNGASAATGTDSDNYTVSNNTTYIASRYTSANYVQGYMSGLRILKGTAQYTAAFTPPTAPPTAITNTQLLLNFTNAGIVDSTAKSVLETVGNVQISTTQSKFGGSSLGFTTAGSRLQGNANLGNAVAFGTGDFTIECWVYLTATNVDSCIIDTRPGVNSGNYFLFYLWTAAGSQQPTISWYVPTGYVLSTGTVSGNTWTHIAICRSGGTIRSFKDGVQQQSASNTTSYANPGAPYPYIGDAYPGGTVFQGFIEDLRITRYARYTGNFTPQTSQWQDQ